ncbi:hypothetical protein D3C85_1259180 [compost metagenome]
MYDHIQIGLDNVNFTPIDGLYSSLVDIDADHFLLARSEYSGGGEADIAQTNDGDCFKWHASSSDLLSGGKLTLPDYLPY